ncbi:MAG TPA: MATE family efflux transporter, partial [Candidatus Acetothermia bacterium]|nr:MATE family efflux transporter [Candidatus Acetothermia bacterium]
AAVTALVAQYMGAGRQQEANYSLNQLFTIALITGVGLGLVGYLLAPWLLQLMVREGAVADAAVLYLRVIFLGLPTMVIPGLFHFAFAATGDTLTPLLVNGVGTLVNIILDPFLVLGWGPFPRLGILGAADATVFAQGVATLAFLGLFVRGKGPLRLEAASLLPHWPWVKKALKIGFPAAVGQSSTAFGFVVMTGVIGRLPNAEAALAGYGIADRILGILFIITDGLSTGLTTMVGQALGAGLMTRARELVRKGLGVLVLILSGEATLLWLLRYPLVGLFIPGRGDVIQVGAGFIQAFAVGMPLLGVFFAALAIYRGAGHNLPTMVLSMLRLWGLRIPLAYLLGFPLGWGASGVWWGMSLSNVISGLAAGGLLARGSWQRSVIRSDPSPPR